MDIIQEHIDILRAHLATLERIHGPVRKYRAGRNCQRGYNCGGSCITRRKNCRKALEGEAKNFGEWMVSKMSAGIPAVVGEAPVDKPKTTPQEAKQKVKDILKAEKADKPGFFKSNRENTKALQELAPTESELKQGKVDPAYMRELQARDNAVEMFRMEMIARHGNGDPEIMMEINRQAALLRKPVLRKEVKPPLQPKQKVPKELQQEIKKKGAGFKFLEQDYLSGVEGKAIAEDALKKAKTPEEKRAAQQELDRYADVAKNGATLTERMPLAMQRALKAAGASGFTKVKNPRPGDKDPAGTKDILLNQWRRDGLIADPFKEAR